MPPLPVLRGGTVGVVPSSDATPSELAARRATRRRDEWRHEVDRLVGEHAAELVAFRRRLHAHPELSGQETRTTEAVAERLQSLGLGKTALFVDGDATPVGFARASANLPHVNLLPAVGANVYDILKHDTLVLTRAAVEKLEARFNG